MLMDFLARHQLNLMILFSGMCGIIAVFVMFMKAVSKRRKISLLIVELSSMFLLMADRAAYIYRRNNTDLGFWMVRISNFSVFFLTWLVLFGFNMYLIDLYEVDAKQATPKRLKFINFMVPLGLIMLTGSQFTGFYYTFDEFNRYQRGPGFMISYIMPFLILVIQLSVIINYYKRLSPYISLSLLLFTTIPMIASILQIWCYGLSLINLTIVGVAVLIYIFALKDMNDTVDHANSMRIEFLTEEQKSMRRLFEQTASALANAIDAKDRYTHGHSARVANYSKTIAKMVGKSEKECDDIYYAALLHDIGKIGISDEIINKEGKLTPEEYDEIKKHPVIGKDILSSIVEFPYLSIGAHHHHERYDGKGYPDKLKGNDIPELARIIAVADAYDAMTSKRSYRDPLPQQKVREIIIEEMGAQFDPVFAAQILHMIDRDEEYNMREKDDVKEFVGNDELVFENFRDWISEGIHIMHHMIRIRFSITPVEGREDEETIPGLVLFDSLDGRAHDDDKAKELLYTEYAELRFDGSYTLKDSRKIQPSVNEFKNSIYGPDEYEIDMVRVKDHIKLTITDSTKIVEFIIALDDSTRYAYLGFTGSNCHFMIHSIKHSDEKIGENYIPRIADLISYIDGETGDIPNVQVDGYRSSSSKGIELDGPLQISFRSKSLPTSRLIWHCPFVSVYSSDDGEVTGDNFREFALVRFDGEVWDDGEFASNEFFINQNDAFEGWDNWKNCNRNGMDCVVHIKRDGKVIILSTENCGIFLKCTTRLKNENEKVYISITGDQCAITNIRINKD